LNPGSGIGRKSASGIRDEQPGSYFSELRNHFFGFFGVKILKFFDEDPGSGMEKSQIRDKHPVSATLGKGVMILSILYSSLKLYGKNEKICVLGIYAVQIVGSGSGKMMRIRPDPDNFNGLC
jgi:hypothetical protein